MNASIIQNIKKEKRKMNEKMIRAKITLGFELTEKEKAYYLLFMATNDEIKDYVRNAL